VFIERTRTALGELMGRWLEDVRLAVMMLDGLEIAGRTHIVAPGITTEGVKIPLGLWEGSTENATLARTLLADLVDRGLAPEQAILFVIDGGKAIRRAIKDVFGARWCIGGTTRSAMSATCIPNATAPPSWPGSAARGCSRTRISPSSASNSSLQSSSAPGPMPPPRSGRGCPRR
jgi:hypothetical protein